MRLGLRCDRPAVGSFCRQARRWLALLSTATFAAACARTDGSSPIALRDYVMFACVASYAKQHALPWFDNSAWAIVEHTTYPAELYARLYTEGEAVAATIRAPNLNDEEHGRPPVLAACLDASRSERIGALIAAQITEGGGRLNADHE